MEQRLLDIRLQMEGLITEREGMIAENDMRKYLGESPAYTEINFQVLNGNIQGCIELLRNL